MRVLIGPNIGYTSNSFLNGGLNIFSNYKVFRQKRNLKKCVLLSPAEITARKHAR